MSKDHSTLFPEELHSSILSDKNISDFASRGLLITQNTYSQNSLEASSYDIRAGIKGIIGGIGREMDLKSDPLELSPGSYAGIISLEKLNLPNNICARIGAKRSLAYDGIILLTGTLVDPGYQGHLCFGLYNASQRKAIIRHTRKICNIVFEKMSSIPEKQAPLDPNLLHGSFPDEFLNRMANMDVLPWMQISERIKQIEVLTKDIVDLKARYDDVLEPIKKLTENVNKLSNDVGSLASETRNLAEDVDKVNNMVNENGKQIQQLTLNIGALGLQNQNFQTSMSTIVQDGKEQAGKLTQITTEFGTYRKWSYIFWAGILLLIGSLLPSLFERFFSK